MNKENLKVNELARGGLKPVFELYRGLWGSPLFFYIYIYNGGGGGGGGGSRRPITTQPQHTQIANNMPYLNTECLVFFLPWWLYDVIWC